jgi:hypothetical protein
MHNIRKNAKNFEKTVLDKNTKLIAFNFHFIVRYDLDKLGSQ